MGEEQMARIAALMAAVVRDGADTRKSREEVRELAAGFPPYPG
jgi:glycine hydroxymethyltransferase